LFSLLAEQKIQEAIAAGILENLAGEGKPLVWHEDACVPADWRLAFHLLHSAGLAPAWIELRRDLERDRLAAVGRFGRRYARGDRRGAEREFAERIAGLNRRIDDLNLIVPHARFQRPRLDGEAERAAACDAEKNRAG
jgi:hypothetical protein